MSKLGMLADGGTGFQLPDWAVDALRQSPSLGICLVVVYVAFKYIREEHARHLASKEAEIERLVKEKNRLQELILKNRLSTSSAEVPLPSPSQRQPSQQSRIDPKQDEPPPKGPGKKK